MKPSRRNVSVIEVRYYEGQSWRNVSVIEVRYYEGQSWVNWEHLSLQGARGV